MKVQRNYFAFIKNDKQVIVLWLRASVWTVSLIGSVSLAHLELGKPKPAFSSIKYG